MGQSFEFVVLPTLLFFYFCFHFDLLLFIFFVFQKREMHSRNKKAMELIAKGWSALKEVDRVIDYAELKDKRLIPLLRVKWI